MKQKMVIKVTMRCERSRSKAMALAARADGVISVGIAGDDKDKLEVVGDGVDTVCLATCLRRKLGHADILQVEQVNDDGKAVPVNVDPPPVEPPTPTPQPEPYGYACHFCHHHHPPPPPPPTVICQEPSNCGIM